MLVGVVLFLILRLLVVVIDVAWWRFVYFVEFVVTVFNRLVAITFHIVCLVLVLVSCAICYDFVWLSCYWILFTGGFAWLLLLAIVLGYVCWGG